MKPTMKPFSPMQYLHRIPSFGRSTQALVTGMGAGLLLMGSLAMAAEIGLLPASHRQRSWHWFLVTAVSGLATVGGISKLEQLQVTNGAIHQGSGWFRRVPPNGSLYEQTTTQLAVHLLELAPGTSEFQQFTVAGAEMLNHVERVHRVVRPTSVPAVPANAPTTNGRSETITANALDALTALNQIMEIQAHAPRTQPVTDGNPSGEIDDCMAAVASPDPWTTAVAPHAATTAQRSTMQNSFFGPIDP
jgi:hypothetical protein